MQTFGSQPVPTPFAPFVPFLTPFGTPSTLPPYTAPAPTQQPAGPPFDYTKCYNDCGAEFGIPKDLIANLAAFIAAPALAGAALTPAGQLLGGAAIGFSGGVFLYCITRCAAQAAAAGQQAQGAGACPPGGCASFASVAEPAAMPYGATALPQGLTATGRNVTPQQALQLANLSVTLSRQLAARGVTATPEQLFPILLQRLSSTR